MVRVAAKTFELVPDTTSEGRTLLGNRVGKVFSPLKSSVVLIEHEGQLTALLTSHLMTHYYRFSNVTRQVVAEVLKIPRERVLCFSSHNHCSVKLINDQYAWGAIELDRILSLSELTADGQQLLRSYGEVAGGLVEQLQEVEIRYGVGHERRITHNRKGRRADGSSFFMREEDRLRYGDDYRGDIDDEAFVVGFFDRADRPVAFLTQFTGHPVTAFHCDFPIVHGEFPQIACDDLSAAYDGVPVAFLQGCAGDVNSKGLLADTPADVNVVRAEGYGHLLGETFIRITKNLKKSDRHDVKLLWQTAHLPFEGVPAKIELQERLAQANGFLKRCDDGDERETRECDGLNFPLNMTVPYRSALVKPVVKWLEWAVAFHEPGRLNDAPRETTALLAVLRLGDVGIVGMPCEPFQGIGRQIKRASRTPLTIPCGYMNDTNIAYVPDCPNCRDMDYGSAFYRYTTSLLPYQKPAGDRMASLAVQMLDRSL